MSVDETDKIDIVTRRKDGSVTLVITDHHEWGDDAHLLRLQEKLNSYLRFIESGEYREHLQDDPVGPVRIEVVTKYEPDQSALDFLFQAGQIAAAAGIPITHRMGSQ